MKQFVYVMRCGAGFHKIGRSANPNARRRQLATSRAQDDIAIVYICGPFNDAGKVECGAHAILKPVRMAGEWFSCSQEEAISAVKTMESGFIDSPDLSDEKMGERSESLRRYIRAVILADVSSEMDVHATISQVTEIIKGYREENARLDSELRDAAELIDEYASEAKQATFISRRALSALERKDQELATLKERLAVITKRAMLEAAIQPSLLN